MKKNKKTIYETPIIIPLGELARGSGAKPTGPSSCKPGGTATKNCAGGGSVGTKPQCKNGSAASNRCTSGASGPP